MTKELTNALEHLKRTVAANEAMIVLLTDRVIALENAKDDSAFYVYGTRVPLSHLLTSIGERAREGLLDTVLTMPSFCHLTREDLVAALHYAAVILER